jgi:hypothetical protein
LQNYSAHCCQHGGIFFKNIRCFSKNSKTGSSVPVLQSNFLAKVGLWVFFLPTRFLLNLGVPSKDFGIVLLEYSRLCMWWPTLLTWGTHCCNRITIIHQLVQLKRVHLIRTHNRPLTCLSLSTIINTGA